MNSASLGEPLGRLPHIKNIVQATLMPKAKSRSVINIGRIKVLVGFLAVAGALAFYINTQINPSGAYFVQQYDKDIFVSEKGNDANSGTSDKPFRSFRKALSSIAQGSSARVIVQDREYRFSTVDMGGDSNSILVPPQSRVLITNPYYVVPTSRLDGVPVVSDATQLPTTFTAGTKLLGVNGQPTQINIRTIGTMALAGFEFVSVNLSISDQHYTNIYGGEWKQYYGKFDIFGNVFGLAGKPFAGHGRHKLSFWGRSQASFFRYNIVHVDPAVLGQQANGWTHSSLHVGYGGQQGGNGRVENNLFQYQSAPDSRRVRTAGLVWNYTLYSRWDYVQAKRNVFVSPNGQAPQGAAGAGGATPALAKEHVGILLNPLEMGPSPDPSDQARAERMRQENNFTLFGGVPVEVYYQSKPQY